MKYKKKEGAGMQIKGLKRLKTLCDSLGLDTLAEIQAFYTAHKQDGEALTTTLERLAKQKTIKK